ncbi:hypothetical protein [Lentzea sp. NPDC051838]|uniref:hypothetical protein n=1 Tax=Lentzea sp. NPDC051838 TaxID=3154849 RepID=UPI0034122775
MDVKTYAAITDLCARLAGRLTDDTLRAIREDYSAGESYQAEATLLLTTGYEKIGMTREEHDLVESTVDERNHADLAAVPIVDDVPLRYRFSGRGPANAPEPHEVDAVLAAHAAVVGGRRLRRAWREPLPGAPDGAKWVYVLQVSEGTDLLSAFAALSGRLWVTIQDKSPIEVVVEGKPLPPYQAALVTIAPQIWSV